MSAGQTDLLACVPAFSRALEGPFDSQRFLHDFSAHAQALVPFAAAAVTQIDPPSRRGETAYLTLFSTSVCSAITS